VLKKVIRAGRGKIQYERFPFSPLFIPGFYVKRKVSGCTGFQFNLKIMEKTQRITEKKVNILTQTVK